MKRIISVFALSFLMTLFVVAQEVTINFEYPQVKQNGKYIELVYSNCFDVAAPGYPVIPFYQYNILEKQNNVSGKVLVKSVEYYDEEIEGRLLPAGKPIPISHPSDVVDRTENSEIYGSKSAYPAENVFGSNTQFLRGHGITTVKIYPAIYYPSENIVRCIKTITFENTSKAHKAEMNAYNDAETMRRIADIADDSSALSSYTYPERKSTDYDILFITSETLLSALQPYINFKTNQGYYCAVELTEHIYQYYQGNDSQEKIRNCVKDYYNNYGIDYLMLVGDADVATPEQNIIPCRGFYAGGDPSIPSDLYYSNLDGTWNEDGDNLFGEDSFEADFYAEVSVGRICADSPDEVTRHTNKLMLYQSSPVANEVEKDLMVGENLNSEIVTWGGTYKDEIAYGTSNHGFTTGGIPSNVSVRRLYERDTTWVGSDLYDVYSKDGVHLVNHLGHSNVEYNMKLNASALTTSHFKNNGINHTLTIQYSQGCYNGSFDNRGEGYSAYGKSDCFAEVFTTLETGHVAQIGNSRYGWYMPGNTNVSSQYYDRLFFDGLYHRGYTKIGDANRYSKEKYTSWVTGYDGDNFRFVNYEVTLFGDPSMKVWIEKPYPILATIVSAVPNTLKDWNIGCNIDKAEIVITKDNAIIYKGNTQNGNFTIDFQSLNLVSGDTMQVNIMADNMIPFITSVGVLNFTPVIDFTFNYSDSQGNNDGIINYGDRVNFIIRATNLSEAPFPGEQVTITCDDDFVELGVESFGLQELAAGESGNVEGLYAYINPNTAISKDVVLKFHLSNNISFETFMTIEVPVISLDSYSIVEKTGDKDGVIEQGETGTITLTYSNSGKYPMRNVDIHLDYVDAVINYSDAVVHFDEIASGESVTCSFDFTVGDCIDGFIIHFLPHLSDEMNISYQKEICYMIGDSKILLVDLDKLKNSMPVLRSDLFSFIGANVDYKTTLPSQRTLNSYNIVFLCAGVYNNNTALKESEQQALINYLQNGGNLYLEGGSVWYADRDYGLKEYFGIEGNPSEESWVNGYTDIVGVEGTDFEGIYIEYNGDNRKIDCVTPINNATQLMVNSPVEFGGAVGNTTDTYKTIGASFEYGGLVENSNGDRLDYAKKILKYFGVNIVGPKSIDLPADTTICVGESIVLDAGEFASYLWSTGDTTRYLTITTSPFDPEDNYDISLTAIDEVGYIASKTIGVTIKNCEGVDDFENDAVTIYPVPAENHLIVKFNGERADMKIFNVTGTMVHNSSLTNGEKVSISDLPKGIYVVRIMIDNNIVTKKIIKQ